MPQQKLYLFVGYPGAGKTTVARFIAEVTGAVHLWADKERQDMFGKAALTAEETAQFYDRLNRETEQLLMDGKSVIFDTNFNYAKDRRLLREIASEHDAYTVLIWMRTPFETAKRRAVEDSHGQDGRVWGNMSAEDFERISSRLEPPADDEQAITFDGTDLDMNSVKQKLGL